MKFGLKMKTGPRTTRAEFIPWARPRSGPKLKTAHGPLALRPRSACQAAMQPKTKTSPPARSHSARLVLQAATWAWTGKVSSRLGQNSVR
jgi:hypothetical protein